ncbi:MAG: hypothetical protein M3308_09550 [Actinomycetota bacterium]|nr:hypothetical protein [Actinomycetota bacterium]
MARTSTWPAGVLALVLAAVLAVIGWLLWPAEASPNYRPAQATVVQGAECGGSNARDVVRLEFDGRTTMAKLDGCGHRTGDVLAVEVPQPVPAGELTVRLAGTGVSVESIIERRLAAVLTVLAGAAGATLAWRVRTRHLD